MSAWPQAVKSIGAEGLHEAHGADRTITSAIDAHIMTERGEDDNGSADALVPAR